MLKKILIVIVITLGLSYLNFVSASESITYKNCAFLRVDDGDTADFSCKKNNNQSIIIKNVRFSGINAPDFSNWCYYKESKDVIISKIKDWNIYTLQILWQDLCKDKKLWCRPVGIITNQKTKKILNVSMVENWFAFYWLNDVFKTPDYLKKLLLNASKASKKNKKWLWNNCSVITQKENLNILNSEWSIPPIRTNYIN